MVGATDNVLTHEGTAVVTALALAEHPLRLSPLVVSLTVQELYEEAVAAGLNPPYSRVGGVFVDRFSNLPCAFPVPPHAHMRNSSPVESMADEYSERRALLITPAHIYMRGNTPPIWRRENGETVTRRRENYRRGCGRCAVRCGHCHVAVVDE